MSRMKQGQKGVRATQVDISMKQQQPTISPLQRRQNLVEHAQRVIERERGGAERALLLLTGQASEAASSAVVVAASVGDGRSGGEHALADVADELCNETRKKTFVQRC